MRPSRILPRLILALATFVPACTTLAEDTSDGSSQAATRDDATTRGYSLGLTEGTRASAPGKKVKLDATKDSYTTRGKFVLHAYFEPSSPDEGANVSQADLFQMNFELTFDEYAGLFESSEDFEIPSREGSVYTDGATASGPLDSREVVLRWQGTARKGEMKLTVGPKGKIRAARMTKYAEGSFSGWTKVFDDSIVEPKGGPAGLLLRDEGLQFRVQDEAKILTALEDSSPESFLRLAPSSGN